MRTLRLFSKHMKFFPYKRSRLRIKYFGPPYREEKPKKPSSKTGFNFEVSSGVHAKSDNYILLRERKKKKREQMSCYIRKKQPLLGTEQRELLKAKISIESVFHTDIEVLKTLLVIRDCLQKDACKIKTSNHSDSRR